jgi:hypothetical protein
METVDFSKSEQYTLSIRLSTEGFMLSVYNPLDGGNFTFIEREVEETLSLTANIKKMLREVEWLNHTFRRVNVLIADKRFVLVPLEFFEDEQIETLFYHSHSARENELVQYNILRKNNAVVLFGMDKSSYNLLKEQYPDIKFYSQASSLIESFSAKSRLGNSRKIYVNLRGAGIEMFCYDRGHLLLANSFECHEVTDRIYYLLYTWKQMGFDALRDELHLSGDLSEKDALLPELKKYIKQVFIMTPATNLDLRSIVLCE